MRTFARSVALITAFAIITRALGFLFRIFLAQVLEPELLGIYQIAFSFFMVFLMAISSGIPLAISRMVSNQQTPQNTNTTSFSFKQIIKSGLIITFSTSILLIALTFALRPLLSLILTDNRSITILMVFLPALLAYSIYTVLRSIWWGQKKFFLLGITELTEQVARIIIFLLLLTLSFLFADLGTAAALSFTLACFTSAIIVVILFIRNNKLKKDKHLENSQIHSYPQSQSSPLKPLLKTSSPITAVKVLTTIAFPIIAIILPMRLISAGWTSSNALAHFGIAVGMTLPLLSIPQTIISSMATALIPELSNSKQNNKQNTERQIVSCIKFTLLINFILFPVFVALGPSIGLFLFGNEQAGIYLSHSAWIMIPMSLSLITNAILNALGRETRAMIHYVIGSIAMFICIWVLPQFIGIGALIVGLGICMSIASVLNIILIGKTTGTDSKIIRLTLSFFLISVPATFTGIFIHGTLTAIFPLFISLPISAIATLSVLFALAYIFKLVEFQDLKVRLQNRKKKKSQT